MPSCVPIRQIRDTKNFSEMVEGSKEPVIVTKDGHCSFVSMEESDRFIRERYGL